MSQIAIMQPYLFPYIGYFQLINAVDEFILYDNLQYTKKGWINRNRILVNGKDEYISIPLKKDSDYLSIGQRNLADSWAEERKKILNKIAECYRKAPYFTEAFPVVEKCISFEETNLFEYILNSLKILNAFLNIKTPFRISSSIHIDHTLKAENKVIAICKALNASEYLNPIGGTELYKKERFEKEGIKLNFLKTDNFEYKQYNNTFTPFLSIIDVMMFNSRDKIKEYLNANYSIL